MLMQNPWCIPVKSVATHSGLGCPTRALSHALAFRGVAMGLAVSSGGMPIYGTVWNGGACSLQNCLANTGAMTVDVYIGMFSTTSTIGARGRQLMLQCKVSTLLNSAKSKHAYGLHSHQTAVPRQRCHNVPKLLNVPPACAVAPNHHSCSNRSCLDLLAVALVGLPDEWMGTRLHL